MAGSITLREFRQALLEDLPLAILDVREAGQFGLEHMLLAVPCPYSVLEHRARRLVPETWLPVVLIDEGDGVAGRAAERLHTMGYADVSVLEGGNRIWGLAGYEIFQGVNVASKAFGEVVEQVTGTPHITADELHGMMQRGEDMVVLDGRTPAEHHRMCIPGGVSVPNAEMLYRVRDLAPDPATTIVVNCAGRTRSIIGAQALINAGVPNRVVALKAGTMGWTLAGYQLEHGSRLRHPETVSDECLDRAEAYSRRLIERMGITLHEPHRIFGPRDGDPMYLFDVRSEEEFLACHVEASVHAPGGQLVQATDHWCAVRQAEILLLDDPPYTRAVATAHWLLQMGWKAGVVTGGIERLVELSRLHAESGHEFPEPPPLPPSNLVTPAELATELAADRAHLIDVGHSMDYREGHIPGAVWSVRPRLADLPLPEGRHVVLCSRRETRARLAAVDVRERNTGPVSVLKGGREAWIAEDRPTRSSPHTPPDEEAIDFLFWVSARHQGSNEAARAYLEWEENLPAQIEADGDSRFEVLPSS